MRGSLKAGKLADMVVIDRNIVENDPEDVRNMQVQMTIVDRQIVFERKLPFTKGGSSAETARAFTPTDGS